MMASGGRVPMGPGGRGKKTKFPDFWEEHSSMSKIRCKTCFEFDTSTPWIHRNSAKSHESSKGHKDLQEHQLRIQEKQTRQQFLMQSLIDAPSADLRMPSASAPFRTSPLHMTQPSLPDLNDNDAQFLDELLNKELEVSFPPLVEDNEDEEQWFNQLLLQESGLWEIASSGSEIEEEWPVSEPDIPSEQVAMRLSEWDQSNKNWYPYPSKTMCLLDLLDNLPRLRLSRNQFKLILWIMRQLGVPNVPSYDQFRHMQENLRKACKGIPTRRFQSKLGNVFYVNDLASLIAQDYSNPHTASFLNFYPEERNGSMSEIWHATKICNLDPNLLTPTCVVNQKFFYVNELAQLTDGRYIIPIRWFMHETNLHGHAYEVICQSEHFSVDLSRIIDIETTTLLCNYEDLRTSLNIQWAEGSEEFGRSMPNIWRQRYPNEEVFTSFVVAWGDDVGGNISKQMNAHKNFYVKHGNLPGRLLQNEFHIKFVSTSPHASTAEQAEALYQMVEETQGEPYQTYNARTGNMCRIRLLVPFLPADNPQQSEMSSHIGPNGQRKCRKCTVGGPSEFIEGNSGYETLYTSGTLRTTDDTIAIIKEQLEIAASGVLDPVTKLQTSTGIKDKVAQGWILRVIKENKSIKSTNPRLTNNDIQQRALKWLYETCLEPWNPLLNFRALDPHRDTPLELLHTILLGLVKYVWHNLNLDWDDKKRATFIVRMQSVDISGLHCPPIRAGYMIQYRNSLIGKHFRVLMQLLPFQTYDLVDESRYHLIRAVGALGALFWVPEIDNIDEYCSDVDTAVANVLDTFGIVDPCRILDKMKLHLLVHASEDIRNQGPLLRAQTEDFEKHNAVFRMSSMHSNHHAPSKDIATKSARIDLTKHIMSGGYLNLGTPDAWLRPGPGIQPLIFENPILQTMFGWAPHSNSQSGNYTSKTKKDSCVQTWAEWILFPVTIHGLPFPQNDSEWKSFKSIISVHGDDCREGNWVVCGLDEMNTCIGRIVHILQNVNTHDKVILVKRYHLSSQLHPRTNTPVLLFPPPDNILYVGVCPPNVLFMINVQHDCEAARCDASGSRYIRQERELTGQTVSVIEHQPADVFLLNIYALHNAHLLRRILPLDLTRPTILIPNRIALHSELAERVRTLRTNRRKRTAEKRASKKPPIKPGGGNGTRKRKRQRVFEDAEPDQEDEAQDGDQADGDERAGEQFSKTPTDDDSETNESVERSDMESDTELPIITYSRNNRPIKLPQRYRQ